MKEQKDKRLESMSEKEFQEFREKYLFQKSFGERLSKEALSGIRKAFALQDYDTLRVKCDEKHTHSLNCVDYDSRYACVVERLIEEIRNYRLYLSKIAGDLSTGV